MLDAAHIASLNCLRLMNDTTAGTFNVFIAEADSLGAGVFPQVFLVLKI